MMNYPSYTNDQNTREYETKHNEDKNKRFKKRTQKELIQYFNRKTKNNTNIPDF